ncbi:MAG TPA: HD-GYP domain-containing protein [Gaiellaceae bacterium]|jgi:HD-GYP domain-containing protein (c-di-GMP phosphodiesterase class II)|nr:HD-GYP domain-containing protein [Gaiellaceae bacterium]
MSIAAVSGSAGFDPAAQRVIEEQRARRLNRLARRERLSLLVSAGAFVACALLMVGALPTERSPGPVATLVLVAVYALAFRLDFEIGTGSAVPTQLVLVPMLFVLPTGIVPIAVAAGVILSSLTEYAGGELHFERVFMRLVNCWHAIGPALVLALAGEPEPHLSQWPLYLAALGAQFALDYGSAALREWSALGVAPKVQFRAMGWVYMIDSGLATIGLAVAFAAADSPYGVVLAIPLVGLLSVFARDRRVRIDHELELRDAYRGTAFLLGDVVGADDGYTGEHSRDVVALTLAVVDELGLSERDRRDAEFAALLHDVGKIRIPNEIINKPGKLTPEEWELMKQHTIEGERLLHRVGGLLGEIGKIIRSCHERHDGTGYPDGLAGEEIPLVARIVACCDAYNAMTTDRSYRKAMSRGEAVAEVRRGAGTQFDPVVVEALIAASGSWNLSPKTSPSAAAA